MAVRVVLLETGQEHVGKFVIVERGMVALFAGIAARKHGGYRGCSRKQIFPIGSVQVFADEPAKEVENRSGAAF